MEEFAPVRPGLFSSLLGFHPLPEFQRFFDQFVHHVGNLVVALVQTGIVEVFLQMLYLHQDGGVVDELFLKGFHSGPLLASRASAT